MSDRDDEQLEVLRAMWGEMKTLNTRLNGGLADLRGEMETLRIELRNELRETRDYLGARIDATNDRVDARLAELKDAVTIGRLDRRRLDRLERRVDALEKRERHEP